MVDITPQGVRQGDVVQLLDRISGSVWIPVSQFNDIGNATLVAQGGVRIVGLTFDQTTDEHADVTWLVPADFDVQVLAEIFVYWSSANTAGKDCTWDIDYVARKVGEDVGVAVSNITAGIDPDSTTADALNIAPAMTLPADTFAATGEILSMSLFRDVSAADDLAADAAFYGIRIDYTTLPSISS